MNYFEETLAENEELESLILEYLTQETPKRGTKKKIIDLLYGITGS